jgi:ribosome-associated heat shock protein Hsp15
MAKGDSQPGDSDKVRLDKWLWAARFYKTRNIAKQFIEGGKVHYNGQRTKPSRFVEINALITLRQGHTEKTVQVLGLEEKRKSAPEAQKLYCETEDSVIKREKEAALRKSMGAAAFFIDHKPNKKERRQISRLKSDIYE